MIGKVVAVFCLIEVTDVNSDFEVLFRAGPFTPDSLKPNLVQGYLLGAIIIFP